MTGRRAFTNAPINALLRRHARDEARRLLQRAADSCPASAPETHFAAVELASLATP